MIQARKMWVWQDENGQWDARPFVEGEPAPIGADLYCPLLSRQQLEKIASSDEGIDADVSAVNLFRIVQSQRKHIARLEARSQSTLGLATPTEKEDGGR